MLPLIHELSTTLAGTLTVAVIEGGPHCEFSNPVASALKHFFLQIRTYIACFQMLSIG